MLCLCICACIGLYIRKTLRLPFRLTEYIGTATHFFPAISHELTTRALPRQRAVSIPSEMMLRQLAYSLQFAPLPFSRCAAVSGLAQRDGNLACCSTKGACHGSRVSAMHDKYVPAIKKSIKNSSALARNAQSIIGAALIPS